MSIYGYSVIGKDGSSRYARGGGFAGVFDICMVFVQFFMVLFLLQLMTTAHRMDTELSTV